MLRCTRSWSCRWWRRFQFVLLFHKDDILFGPVDETIARATQHLRTGTGDVVDRIEAWLADESGREGHDPEISRLRDDAITHDPVLRGRAHQQLEQVQSEIATAVARDTGAAAGGRRPAELRGGRDGRSCSPSARSASTAAATQPPRARRASRYLRGGLTTLG